MVSDYKKSRIATACAPAVKHQQNHATQPRIWTLPQMGSGMLGEQSLMVACIRDQRRDHNGFLRSQTLHPVFGDVQHDPRVARKIRTFEIRVGVTVDKRTGLTHRMCLEPGAPPNSWLMSAESVMRELVGTWGYVLSDRDAEIYRFQRLRHQQTRPTHFPDIGELVDELLEEYIIDSLEHPVLQRLLGLSSSETPGWDALTQDTATNEGDDADVY